MQAITPWGEIRVSWISKGEGRGEIHVAHYGGLIGHETKLEKLVTTLMGRTDSFGKDFWVVRMRDGQEATETTALAFIQAITNLATREAEKAKKAAARERS